MFKIELARIDARLIHGQVITKWVRQTFATRIVIIDDGLAVDDFMKSIYEMAAPPNMKVDVFSVQQAASKWKENEMAEDKIFLLFKDVETAFNSIKAGIKITDLQIGGLGDNFDRKKVFGPISLNELDANMLKELSEDNGVRVYLHQVPEEPKMELAAALDRYETVKKK